MNGLKNVRNRRDDALTRVDWDRLETMLADYYRAQGWSVDHVGTGASRARFDGGIDLKLRKDGEYVLVQCKHWNAKQVAHNAVHELLGIKINESATGAVVITSGEFTQAAKDAAVRQGHVQLIDGDALRAMLGPQLDAIAAMEPPPLPDRHPHSRRSRTPASNRRVAALLIAIPFALLVCYGAYRLLTAPFLSYPIDIDLPQRVIGPPRAPDTRRPVHPTPVPTPQPRFSEAPAMERGMSGEELEEWKRKNAESMRMLEENEKRRQEQADAQE